MCFRTLFVLLVLSASSSLALGQASQPRPAPLSAQSLLECWGDDLSRIELDQGNAARRWHRRSFGLGLALVVLTAITGASFFTQLAAKRKKLVIVLSLSAAILAGSQSLLNPSARAAEYWQASGTARDIRRQVDEALTLPADQRPAAVSSIRKRIGDLEKATPISVFWPQKKLTSRCR